MEEEESTAASSVPVSLDAGGLKVEVDGIARKGLR